MATWLFGMKSFQPNKVQSITGTLCMGLISGVLKIIKFITRSTKTTVDPILGGHLPSTVISFW